MPTFNKFGKTYLGQGRKRKRDEFEVVVPSSQPVFKKRKIAYEVPDNSPAWNMVIPRGLQVEKKGVDTTISGTGLPETTSTNAGIYPLNLIQQGTGSWNRIGRKTKLKSVRIQGNISNSYVMANGDNAGNIVRCILVWDKQPSGNALPTFETIFGVTDQSGTESCTIYSPPKYDTMDRFRVLKDWKEEFVVYVQPLANADSTVEYRDIDCYLKLGDLESVYSGQSNPMTIADINSGALYFILRAQTNSATTSQASVALNARVRFIDP